jgi:ATP-binding cassette, subfamily C (CFTR/MRP), member 1
LLGLAQIESGDVDFDGIPIKDVALNTTRLRTIAVPQDPLILPGTVRFNMDPLSEHDDAAILLSLEEVGILDTINSRGGLDAQLEGMSLSRGQQQLFCLARATLSNSRIVLLDEVTSSVDAATEAKMMEVVDKRFEGRTIVAVAHHLETLRDFDMIVVLDKGRLVETGSPRELLGRQSVFRELWEKQH